MEKTSLKRWGVDIDGVLARFEVPYAKLITKETGLIIPVGADGFPQVWDWDKDLLVKAGLNPKAVLAKVWEQIKTTGFWATLPPFPDAQRALNELTMLKYAGHDIYFITSRPGFHAKALTEEWLQRNGFSVPTVLIAGDALDKSAIGFGLKLDIFIDDKPENCVFMQQNGPAQCQTYIIDRPYNQALQAPGIRREASLLSVIDRVMEEERERLAA